MPHQCVHCSRIIPATSAEILEGCSNCGGKFFYYIRDEQLAKIKENSEKPVLLELKKEEKVQVESDVRGILGIEDDESPIILDLESVKALEPGKFEIDLVGLINKKPIVFKLEEGKYLIDLESGMPSKRKDKNKFFC